MKEYKRILVGLSLDAKGEEISAGSCKAALQAKWLADRTSASVTFYHSSSEEPQPGIDTSTEPMRRLAQDCKINGKAPEIVSDRERPWLSMIRRVLRGENDIVIVARRSEASSDVKLGTNTRKLIRKCPAPVWVVRPDHDLVHRSVLAATDLTPVGARATQLGAYLANAFDCPLHVVHAWQIPLELQLHPGPADADPNALKAIGENAKQEIFAGLEGSPAVEHVLHIGCNSPTRAILQCIEAVDPDLLVMGTISRTGIAGLLMGNTAERLMDRVETSLLTIKPADFESPVKLEE